MIADAGSQAMTIDEIKKALFPMAASFDAQVDKEMTTFTGARPPRQLGALRRRSRCRSSRSPASARRTSGGSRTSSRTRSSRTCATNNEEELGKERLQALVFAGTPYGHPVLGTVAGIDAITLDDVKDFVRRGLHARRLTRRAVRRRCRRGSSRASARRSRALPAGPALAPPAGVVGRRAARASRSRSSRRRRAPRAISLRPPDRGRRARTPTSRRSTSPAPGSASTAPPRRTSSSASASCAG